MTEITTDRYFFGYGSLVNRDTHGFGDAHPARLTGWRRVWRHTDLRPVAYLTVEPDSETSIDGLIAHVPANDWAALDERERAYDRVGVQHAVSHPKPATLDIAVYHVPRGKHGAPDACHPILLSYIDTVVQGFLREYGAKGVKEFFATADGWNAPIRNDRAAPIYPRATQLSGQEISLVDSQLAEIGATLI